MPKALPLKIQNLTGQELKFDVVTGEDKQGNEIVETITFNPHEVKELPKMQAEDIMAKSPNVWTTKSVKAEAARKKAFDEARALRDASLVNNTPIHPEKATRVVKENPDKTA